MALTPDVVDELFDQNKKLLELWMQIHSVMVKALADEPLTDEQETQYLQLKGEISRIYRLVSEKLPTGLFFDGDKMMEMLKNAMTLEQLQKFPLPERQNFQRTWHLIYIKLTRALGALEVMQHGYYPHLHRAYLKLKS